MKAKKSLGQNFLHSPGVLGKIVTAAELSSKDTVLEVGPGMGVLTRKLLGLARSVVAVEKDARLIEVLTQEFSEEISAGRLVLLAEDALTFDLERMRGYVHDRYKVVANIPYYITGALIEKLLSASSQPEHMVLLLQKEVVERIVARDGKESILSLSVKAYGTPRYKGKVGRGSFRPVPNVDSAILSIEDISRDKFENEAHERRFFEVVRAGFAHKRKYVWRNLEGLVSPEALRTAAVDAKARAEDLRLSQWLAISRNRPIRTKSTS